MTCPACGKDVLDIDVKCAHCGAALGSTGAHRMLGSVMLGQYELVDVLGQGGMSVVFKGRHKLTEQEVALKILPPELAAHSQVKSRFLDEAKALASLDHANIVHLYNFGQENGYFVLAMQFVHGQTWERMILESSRLDWATSCRIAIDVLRALEYAHGAGIVHRDMKPSNVLVRARDGVATVMDFGIAKMTTSTRLTATGQTMGTVRYMSPEQVRGQEVDLRTDLYSLGATLYESLTGDTPFDGSTHFEIMTKHLQEVPIGPSRRGVTLPQVVEDAVMRALAKKADDRFTDAREMRKLLEGALRDGDLGLIETQRLDRGVLGELRATSTPVAIPPSQNRAPDPTPATGSPRVSSGEPERATRDERGPNRGDRKRAATTAGKPRRMPWLAVGLAMLVGGGVAAALVVMQRGRPRTPPIEITGVALPDQQAVGALTVATDGTLPPAELARLYHSTLDALRLYVRNHPGAPASPAPAGPEVPEPIDALLAVPSRALCEPTAYFDGKPPTDCTMAVSAIAIGAQGKRRLMVVSERGRLIVALRKGVAQAACEFSPLEDTKRIAFCDLTNRFAESQN